MALQIRLETPKDFIEGPKRSSYSVCYWVLHLSSRGLVFPRRGLYCYSYRLTDLDLVAERECYWDFVASTSLGYDLAPSPPVREHRCTMLSADTYLSSRAVAFRVGRAQCSNALKARTARLTSASKGTPGISTCKPCVVFSRRKSMSRTATAPGKSPSPSAGPHSSL